MGSEIVQQTFSPFHVRMVKYEAEFLVPDKIQGPSPRKCTGGLVVSPDGLRVYVGLHTTVQAFSTVDRNFVQIFRNRKRI